jgi:ABC-2 type transport system permease protein
MGYPSPLAFAAFGQRDLQPSALRVRALGLHAQLYESETINPDLALPGRLDFAFILIYLVPLIIIALMHDLVTSERESRRLRLMQSLPVSQMQLWLRRTAVRALLVFVITALPFSVSAWIAGADIGSVSGVLGISALYIAFWFGLSLLIAARAGSSASAAAILLSCFVVFTLVLPTVSNVLITGRCR